MNMQKRRVTGWILSALLLTGCGGPSVAADSAADIPQTKYIALTFDDGPKAGTTDVLLDGLRDRGASATFSWWGNRHSAIRNWCGAWARRAIR